MQINNNNKLSASEQQQWTKCKWTSTINYVQMNINNKLSANQQQQNQHQQQWTKCKWPQPWKNEMITTMTIGCKWT